MNRLALRFKGGSCMSVDCFGDSQEAVDKALENALTITAKVYPGKEVAKVELLVYDPGYVHKFVEHQVDVEVDALNARLQPVEEAA